MQGVALTACPCRTGPDDSLARMVALYYFPQSLVVAQRVEVVFVHSALAAIVETIVRRSLAKVAFYCRYTLLHQSLYFLLIPVNSFWVREVEYCILHRHSTCGILYVQSLLDNLVEESVLRCEVWQLPQAGVETVLCQLFQHLYRILESVFGKLVVALPIGTKPACVKVYHVGRYAVCSQLAGYLQSFLLREVGNTAHPCTKAP